MDTNKRQLMKIFAAVLRKRSLETGEVEESINPLVLKTLKRKDLIQIITDKFDGSIPKGYKLLEMENEELLSIIKDDMHIIAYMTQRWAKEKPAEQSTPNKTFIEKVDTVLANVKSKEDTKKDASTKPKSGYKGVKGENKPLKKK